MVFHSNFIAIVQNSGVSLDLLPKGPLQIPELEGPMWTLRLNRTVTDSMALKPKPFLSSCDALLSLRLNWVIAQTCGKVAKQLVGYTVDGVSRGQTFQQASAHLRALYERKMVTRRRHIEAMKQESIRLITQREAELKEEQRRQEVESQDLFQNIMSMSLQAVGTAVTGLQQMQAAKQGIPPTVNIVPGQAMAGAGAFGSIPGGAAGDRHLDEAIEHLRQAIASGRQQDAASMLRHCEEAAEHLTQWTRENDKQEWKADSIEYDPRWKKRQLLVHGAQGDVDGAATYPAGILARQANDPNDPNRGDHYRAGIMLAEKAINNLVQAR